MDAATLVVIFLLVTAASLASYLLSQWSYIRNISIGWVAISSIGTVLLLVAAAVVVLALGLLPALRLWPNIESGPKSVQLEGGSAGRVLDGQEASTETSNSRNTTTASTGNNVRRNPDRYMTDDEQRSGMKATSATTSQHFAGARSQARGSAASYSDGPVFSAADPWAATNCVYAFNPDPEDLTRWTIENGCGVPVGIVFAACLSSPPECSTPQSTWKYQMDGMILPGRAQRPVTDKEETQYGSQIRYVACLVAVPLAIRLIGENSETRSSPSWFQQFDAARQDDECLTLVEKWSAEGLHSGKPIDTLLGADVPGKIHGGSTSEL